MDLEHPFSLAFGPASNRDELLMSAENVYSRLLKLAPGSTLLPYSVLAVLSDNDDGTVDREKRRSLRNLYRPDMDEEVTLLAFIQSCDTVSCNENNVSFRYLQSSYPFFNQLTPRDVCSRRCTRG
jgi:hypothetical protein